MKKIFTLVAGVMLVTMNVDAARAVNGTGWWVLIGSFPAESKDTVAEHRHMEAKARPCGLRYFNDHSGKWLGFSEGRTAFVSRGMPFPSRTQAEGERRRIRQCFPDAYVKYGQYLGE